MANDYYNTISKLEQEQVSRHYILGWASGFLGNPEIEEQRMTEDYRAGYADGRAGNTAHADNWKSPSA